MLAMHCGHRPRDSAFVFSARAAAFLVFLVAPLCGGDAASVAGTNGVYCGNQNRLCPRDSPICCGSGPSEAFCIAAGYACCEGDYSGPRQACAQGQECCPSFYETLCCDVGQRCHRNPWSGHAECVPDVCAPHHSQDSCLAESADSCGWCCEEHRCTSLTASHTAEGDSNYGCNSPPLKQVEERCDSRCYGADTCALCTSGGRTGCAWCCATMTCMPLPLAVSSCPHEQYTVDRGRCVGCYAGGAGVSERANEEVTLYSLAASFMVFFAIGALLALGRVLAVLVANREAPTVEQVQRAVTRYGFAATDAQPSSPINHNRHQSPQSCSGGGGGNANTESSQPNDDSEQQPLLSSAAAKGYEGKEDAPDRPSAPAAVTAEGAASAGMASATTATPQEPATSAVTLAPTCSSCRKALRLTELERRLSSMAPAFTDCGDTHTGTLSSSPIPERKDDPIIIFLPCGHCCCYACVGIPADVPATRPTALAPVPTRPPLPPSEESTEAPAPTVPSEPVAAAQCALAATPAPLAGPAIEELIQRRRKGRCPVCKKKYTDLLVTEKVRSI